MTATVNIDRQEWMRSSELVAVMEALGNARLVGGCVRDAYLELPIHDIDITTPHTPEKVTELLQSHGMKVIPTGIDHGTVTAVVNNRTFEITTLRRDIECYGRHAVIEFTDDWTEDAARRDFTINALSMDLKGTIYDYFDGIADLKKGKIRFVGDPRQRVQEDYLRILRYFRFEAHYGTHAIDKPSLSACKEFASEIKRLSGERIQREMFKLFTAVDPHYILQLMAEEGMLQQVIPGLDEYIDMGPIRHLMVIEKEEGSVVPSNDALVRIAILLGGKRKQAEKLAERWKLSNVDRERLLVLVDPPVDIIPDIDETTLKESIRSLGKELFIAVLLVIWANDEDNENIKAYKSMMALANTWEAPVFPVRGEDVVGLGVKPGKDIGKLLKLGEKYWSESDYRKNKDELLNYIQNQFINKSY